MSAALLTAHRCMPECLLGKVALWHAHEHKQAVGTGHRGRDEKHRFGTQHEIDERRKREGDGKHGGEQTKGAAARVGVGVARAVGDKGEQNTEILQWGTRHDFSQRYMTMSEQTMVSTLIEV